MIARVSKPTSYYIKQTLYLTLPIFIESFIGTLVDLFGLHFIGKSEPDEVVGGAGLGLMISNILVLSVVTGFQSAFQTLGSQSFGKKDYYMCSVYHWRARILTLILSLLLSVLLFFAKYIFQLLHIHPDVASIASTMCRYLIFYNLLNAQVELLYIHMQNQLIYNPQMIVGGIVSCITPLVQYLFIIIWKQGVVGLAIAKIIHQVLILVILFFYCQFSKCCGDTWKMVNRDSLKGWKQFIKLGVDGILMVCLEWWTFEILNFIAAYLGPVILAANVIIGNISLLLFRIGVSFGVGALALVGNEVGDGNVEEAKKFAVFGVICNSCLVLIIGLPFMIVPSIVGKLYTNDVVVLDILKTYIPAVCAYEVMDSVLEVNTQILAAVRLQNYAYRINLTAYYLYSIPLAIINIALLKWKLGGLYFPYLLGSCIRLTLQCLKLFTLNWKKTIAECREKLEFDANEVKELRE